MFLGIDLGTSGGKAAIVDAAVLELDSDLRAGVQGVVLAGQVRGANLMGDDDRPLRPAILWNDGRSFAQCAELEAAEPQSGRQEWCENLANRF